MSDATPVVVLIVHGVGAQQPHYAQPIINDLRGRCADLIGSRSDAPAAPRDQFIFRAVHWADVLQPQQLRLWYAMTADHSLRYGRLRRYLIEFAGDAIAYQITSHDREVYDAVHNRLAAGLKTLVKKDGAPPAAPLAIIAHSLGTVIASNFIWDLQRHHYVRRFSNAEMTPIEHGETLARLFTMGSPIPLWSLRFRHPPFGVPITMPDPGIWRHYPAARCPDLTGQWLNFFDADDVIACPLKPLNNAYREMVTADIAVNVGSPLTSWNPLSHNGYWTDRDVTVPIARSLADLWRTVNPSPTPDSA